MGVDPCLRCGSILMFDEFRDLEHEFRAFQDYKAACSRELRVIACCRSFLQVACEIVDRQGGS